MKNEVRVFRYTQYWFGDQIIDLPFILSLQLLELGIHIDWQDYTLPNDDYQTFVGIPYRKIYIDPFTLEAY